MLQIDIQYESAWCNSFLDGDNNSPLGKEGRTYVASLKNLNDRATGEQNFIRREITDDTVAGVLNRLIGDQRKLYQSRADSDYYFRALEKEKRITFIDQVDVESHEIVHLRNFSKSYDQNAFSGMIDANHAAFTSDFSVKLWSVLFLELDALCDFVLNDNMTTLHQTVLCPTVISEHYNNVVGKIKNIKVESSDLSYIDRLLKTEAYLAEHFNVNYRNSAGTDLQVYSLYCSALYLQVERLSKHYALEKALTKTGGLSGFSKRGFTYKDFMKSFTTGEGKMVFGNPYFREVMRTGLGKTKEMLKKRSGKLSIQLRVEDEHAKEIMNMISNAGVMSFKVGKKGLAFVEKMRIITE